MVRYKEYSQGLSLQIVLDQLRTIDKARFVKKLGTIDSKDQLEVISILQRLFTF